MRVGFHVGPFSISGSGGRVTKKDYIMGFKVIIVAILIPFWILEKLYQLIKWIVVSVKKKRAAVK